MVKLGESNMAKISIRRLAENLNSDVEQLLPKLKAAGINKSGDDSLTEEESKKLLDFLTQNSTSTKLSKKTSEEGSTTGKLSLKSGKLSLNRKRSSEKLVTDSTGKKHTVKVVRKKERVVTTKKSSLISEEPKPEVVEEDNSNNLKVAEQVTEAPNNKIEEVLETTNKADTENLTTNLSAESNLDELSEKSEKPEDIESSKELDTKDKKKAKKKLSEKTSDKTVAKENFEPDDKNTKNKTPGKSAGKTAAKTKKFQDDEFALDSASALDAYKQAQEDTNVETYVKPRKSLKTVKEVKQNIILDIEQEHSFKLPTKPMIHEVAIPDHITVADLAQRMSLKAGRLIKTLIGMGTMATINQVLDQDTAVLLVEELGHKPKLVKENVDEENLLSEYQAKLDNANLTSRAPVVTIMGHVDHGKTSLLDYIRTTKVTAKEAGGITQHIGAYSVKTDNGKITFLDTPGHAAFSAMRARGANVTDIVILVVSADDGVMPQTVEAIQHAKAAGVPIIVAINKIDKPEADPEKVTNGLSQYGIIPEDWGGENQFVSVSAKTGQGIDNLLDAILLQTEMLELKSAENIPAKGVVVESRLDKGRGAVATILVQQGTLKRGDIILVGSNYGKVRAMYDASGHKIEDAGPSEPVEVLGLSLPPNASDEVMVVDSERKAREIALYRQSKIRQETQEKARLSSVDDLFSKSGVGNECTLNIIVKADVQGSCEAIIGSFDKIESEEVAIKVVGHGVGGISESDVTLAMASKAIIIGFNVRAEQSAKRLAEQENVKIIYDSIIYNVIDDVKAILSGMLSPEIREEITGLAEVRDVFRSSKIGAIAGCMVIEGVVKRNNPIRVLRDNVVIYEGELESLRRFKDDVNEVKQGIECGIGVKNYNDVKAGDQIEVFKRVEVSRNID